MTLSRKKLIEAALPLDAITAASSGHCRPFRREPDFGVVSVNHALGELIAAGEV